MNETEARAVLTARLGAVAGGDRAALRDIYLSTSAKLFGICLRILQDRNEAEDVLQEVYITVWNRAGRFDPALASPITWLAAIARNRSIDRLRARRRRQPETALDDAPDLADESPSALEAMERSQSFARLRACLGALDTRSRKAITEAFYGGATYAELAERAATPLGTMKSWIRRGLASLKECLAR
jgi:RNA polymerase sigma-70 factor (ECF subfamily)